jgi:hypothetical protein
MARGTQKQSRRVEVADPRLSPVSIQEHTRYINARADRSGIRAAEALQNAFQTGVQELDKEIDRRNLSGQERAIAARATGTGRDAEDENFGYNQAWDTLDAEYDMNLAAKELPELLRGFNAEERDEAEVQAFITDYYENTFGGVELMPESAYTQYVAPKMLELETAIIADHRDSKIAQIQEEQRSKIFANTEASFLATGELNYDKLFKETGVFFENEDKKIVLWETIYDLAIDQGRPDIIENMPKRINGVPSGIDDPKKQDEHRTAINAATAAASRKLATEEANLKGLNDQLLKDTQLQLVNTYIGGGDVSEYVNSIRVNPESTFSDITAAINFSQTEITDAQRASPDVPQQALLWGSIYQGETDMTQVIEAHNMGVNGFGPQANDELKAQLSAVRTIKAANAQGGQSNGPQITSYRGQLNDTYNPSRQGALGPIDPTLSVVRNEAINEFHRRVYENGEDPRSAHDAVREQFDTTVDRLQPTALSELGGQSQSTSAKVLGLTITAADARRFANGEMSYEAFVGSRSGPELVSQLEGIAETLSLEDREKIAQQFANQ